MWMCGGTKTLNSSLPPLGPLLSQFLLSPCYARCQGLCRGQMYPVWSQVLLTWLPECPLTLATSHVLYHFHPHLSSRRV